MQQQQQQRQQQQQHVPCIVVASPPLSPSSSDVSEELWDADAEALAPLGAAYRPKTRLCIDDMKFHDESRSHCQHGMQSLHGSHHDDSNSQADSPHDQSAPIPTPYHAPLSSAPLTFQQILAEERMHQQKVESWGVPPLGEEGILALVAAKFHEQS